ncbi:MAG TPA: beta family protein [Thermoguttaceae bacterium]|nr:beta family protein [Thermoguttaceae bacterium]
MITLQPYSPILKTSTAELRGLRELTDDVKGRFTPIFELTRSRKTKAFKEGDINRQLDNVASAYPDRPFILDLTGHAKHRNSQIRELQKSVDGYKGWVDFLIKKKSGFPGLIPVLQINDEDVDTERDFYDRLSRQVKSLDGEFKRIVYRLPFDYDDFGKDLETIGKALSLDKLIAVVDAGFIPQGKAAVYGRTAIETIKDLLQRGVKEFVVAGSSFPLNPTEYGEDQKGKFKLEEVLFFECVQEGTEQKLLYGDYATIHPEPSLQAGGQGWVPRIDLPARNLILYRRSRKDKTEKTYAKAYTRAAREVARLLAFSTVSRSIGSCWGLEQIHMAANGHPPGLSPSYWISARINIHISLRVATK